MTVIDAHWDDTRLPGDVFPVHYDLEFHPHIYGDNESLYFVSGRAEIHIHCKNPTNQILLHAQNIRLGDVSVKSNDGNANETHLPSVVGLGFVKEKNILFVILEESLFEDWDYILTIDYFEASMDHSGSGVKYGFSAFNYEDEVFGRAIPG